MAKQHLLIVDSDSKSQRVLEVSLKKAGFSITKASNGIDALEKIEISIPDMIITETDMPKMDGFELIKRLGQNQQWEDIPVIFLTAKKSIEDKIRGLEQGVEDYLTKPIFIREILARVSLVVQRRQRERLETRGSRTEFSGSLSDMGIIDLIQTIDISQKSGVISVQKDGDQGEIFFKNGKVIDAKTSSRQGGDAVYRMLVWSEGTFRIEFININSDDNITLSTQGLLMEGMRRLDEWGRLQEQLPPLSAVFDIDDELLAERLGEIPDEINSLLKHFNGERTLMEVVDLCPLGDLEALTIITKLYFEGLICGMEIIGEDRTSDTEAIKKEELIEQILTTSEEEFSNEGVLTNEILPESHDAVKNKENDEDIEKNNSTLRLPKADLLPEAEKEPRRSLSGSFVLALSGKESSDDEDAMPENKNKRKTDDYLLSIAEEKARVSANVSQGKSEDQKHMLMHVSRTPTDPPPAFPGNPSVKSQAKEINDNDDKYFSGETYTRQFGYRSSKSTYPPYMRKLKSTVEKNEESQIETRPVPPPYEYELAEPEENRVQEQEPIENKKENKDEILKEIKSSNKKIQNSDSSKEFSSKNIDEKKESGNEIQYEKIKPRKKIISSIAILTVFGILILGVYNWPTKTQEEKNQTDLIIETPQQNQQSEEELLTSTEIVIDSQQIEDTEATIAQEPDSVLAVEGDIDAEQESDSADIESQEENEQAETQKKDLNEQYFDLLKKASKGPRQKRIELLEQAIAINPRGIRALTDYAVLTMESKDYHIRALEAANRAIELDDNNARAWLSIGYINQQQGKTDQAQRAYKKCSESKGPAQVIRDCKLLQR